MKHCGKVLLVLMFVMGICLVSSSPSFAELVAYWNFDEGSGSVVHDSSGYGNNGSLSGSGTTWPPGVSGSALEFDGNGWVTVPHSSTLNPPTALTLDLWVYPHSYPPEYVNEPQWNGYVRTVGLITKWGWNDSYVLAFTYLGQIGLTVTGGPVGQGPYSGVISNATLPLNAWSHITATWSKGSTINIFLNGILDNTASAGNFDMYPGTHDLWIGQDQWGPMADVRFDGIIDEVKIYNNAVPEPTTMLLLGFGLLGTAGARRKMHK